MSRQPAIQPGRPHAWWLTVALLPTLWSGTALAELRAFFDRPTVYEGDSVTLTIEAEGRDLPGQPDLAPLADDFDVLGTSQGSEIRIVNGRRSDKRSWRITLAPKSIGNIDIPPIAVGDERTAPLMLTVSEVPQGAQGGPGDDVYVEVELGIDGDRVMVQQQIPIVVRLYSGLLIRGGELSDPRADGAVLERLGNDRQYETTRNGRDYQVIERRFSLSPERSGELRIAPVVFEGEVVANRGDSTRGATGNDRLDRLFANPMVESMFRDSPFTMFERGEPVRAQAEAITLQVDPRPAGFGGAHWLPAEAVAIDDSWAKEPPRLRAGEPATRTLTLTAKGLAGTQIPEIEIPVPAGVRAYPEKTETESRTDGATLFGVSAQRLTLIPTAGGALEMPEIRVTWWDTVAQIERVATVPAMTLDVEGPTTSTATPAPASAPAPSNASVAPELGATEADGAAATSPAQPLADEQGKPGWPVWVGIGALALLIGLGSALFWYRRRRRPTAQASLSVEPPPRLGKLREAFSQACAQNDPHAAARALLDWAQACWPRQPPANLAAVAARMKQGAGSEASQQIQALERRLYARDAGPWNGNALWLALKDGLGKTDEQRRSGIDDLEPLYPHRPGHTHAGGSGPRPHPGL